MNDLSEERLDRIETKLDKVSEAIISLARMEEKMITLFNRMDSYDVKHEALNGRVHKVEISQATNSWVERVVWILVAGAIASAMWFGK
jgi:50S ribosomal subunit-associated GTPase HflX